METCGGRPSAIRRSGVEYAGIDLAVPPIFQAAIVLSATASCGLVFVFLALCVLGRFSWIPNRTGEVTPHMRRSAVGRFARHPRGRAQRRAVQVDSSKQVRWHPRPLHGGNLPTPSLATRWWALAAPSQFCVTWLCVVVFYVGYSLHNNPDEDDKVTARSFERPWRDSPHALTRARRLGPMQRDDHECRGRRRGTRALRGGGGGAADFVSDG